MLFSNDPTYMVPTRLMCYQVLGFEADARAAIVLQLGHQKRFLRHSSVCGLWTLSSTEGVATLCGMLSVAGPAGSGRCPFFREEKSAVVVAAAACSVAALWDRERLLRTLFGLPESCEKEARSVLQCTWLVATNCRLASGHLPAGAAESPCESGKLTLRWATFQ